MPNPDAIRLRHMREAAASAMEMAAGRSRSEQVSLSSVPVAKVISMRSQLIHAYFDVDLHVVWTTVIEDLPALLPALNAALAQFEG
jgi:uncharacterized protein with HEPN domain